MRLFFIRHGQSANNHMRDRTGNSRGRSEDPELTVTGLEQVRLLAEYIQRVDTTARERMRLKTASAENGAQPGGDGPANSSPLDSVGVNGVRRDYFGFTHLYTSLMIRSVQTGTPISQVTGVPLRAWVDIHESGGIYLDDEVTGEPQGLPGRTRSYFTQRFPHLVLPDSINEDGWWNRPAETDLQRPERARRVLAELLERHGGTNDRVAMISHGGFYNHLMRAIFGGDATKTSWVMHNTGITRVDFSSESGRTLLIYHNRTEHLPKSLIT